MRDFGWAPAQMRMGLRVRRLIWNPGRWLAMTPGRMLFVDDADAMIVNFDDSTIIAVDWEIVP